MLQREGRLIDFLQEDLAAFPDADVGAAARAVRRRPGSIARPLRGVRALPVATPLSDLILAYERMGCCFSRLPDGRIAQRPFGGHSAPRAVYAALRAVYLAAFDAGFTTGFNTGFDVGGMFEQATRG